MAKTRRVCEQPLKNIELSATVKHRALLFTPHGSERERQVFTSGDFARLVNCDFTGSSASVSRLVRLNGFCSRVYKEGMGGGK